MLLFLAGAAPYPGHEPDALHELGLAGFLWSQTASAVQRATDVAGCWLPGLQRASACSPRGWSRRPSLRPYWSSTALYARDFAPWRRLHLSSGLPLFLVITVPWHWLAARRLPDFLQFFFVHEHLARYLTPSADREESWWFFGARVFVRQRSVDAIGAAGDVSRLAARGPLADEFNPVLFLRIWVLFVCVFFSLSDSKLIPYILPAMPALALLMAALPAGGARARDLRTAFLTLCAAIGLAARLPRSGQGSSRRRIAAGISCRLAKPLAQIAALLAASGLYVLVAAPARRRPGRRCSLGVGWCLSGLLLMRAAAAGRADLLGGGTRPCAARRPRARTPSTVSARMINHCHFIGGARVELWRIAANSTMVSSTIRSRDTPSVAQFVERWNLRIPEPMR